MGLDDDSIGGPGLCNIGFTGSGGVDVDSGGEGEPSSEDSRDSGGDKVGLGG